MDPENQKVAPVKDSIWKKIKDKFPGVNKVSKSVLTTATVAAMTAGAVGAVVSPVLAQGGEEGPGKPTPNEEWKPADQNKGEKSPNQNGPNQNGRQEDQAQPFTQTTQVQPTVGPGEKVLKKVYIPQVFQNTDQTDKTFQQTPQNTTIKEGDAKGGGVKPFSDEQDFSGRQKKAFMGSNPSSKPVNIR